MAFHRFLVIKTKAENKYLSEGNSVYNYSQNGRNVNPKLRSFGFKLGAFRNEVRVGVPSLPPNFHLRGSTRGNLSTFRWMFQFPFGVSVGGRCYCLNSVQHVTQDLGRRQEEKNIHFSYFLRTERERQVRIFFLAISINNELYRA